MSDDSTLPADPALAPTMGGAAPAGTLAAGERLGDRYVVRRRLGAGGMGTVYLALDEKLDEEIALKVVSPELAGLLRDEVRLAQKVTHPNVCRTYDLEELGALQVVKMEYVPGETLAARLEKGKLSVEEAVGIARQLASGLAAAHAQGIVHGDLKPLNVMLRPDGRAVLMDFGVASRGSTAGRIAGTPGFIAPEVLAGKPVDGRADLYALGRMLDKMVEAKPRWLARAIVSLTAEDPGRRDVRLLDGPRRGRWIVAGAVLAAAAAGAIVALRPHPWRPHIVDIQPVVEENSDALSFSPDGKWIAYPSDRDQTNVFRIYVQPLAGGTPRAVTPPDRSAGQVVWSPDGDAVLTVFPDRLETMRVPLDGSPPSTIATGFLSIAACGPVFLLERPGTAGSTLVVDDQGSFHDLATLPGNVLHPACSRDGRRIVVAAGEVGAADLYEVGLDGSTKPLFPGTHVSSVTLSGDGSHIAYAAERDGVFGLFERKLGGGPEHELTTGIDPLTVPVIAPDGDALAFNTDTTQFVVVMKREGMERTLGASRQTIGWLHSSADGKSVYTTFWDHGTSYAMVLDEAGARRLDVGFNPVPSVDGTTVYFADGHVLKAIAPTGGASRAIADLGAVIGQVAAGPDGAHVLVGEPAVGYHVSPDGQVTKECDAALVIPSPGGTSWALLAHDEHGRWIVKIGLAGSCQGGVVVPTSAPTTTWLDDHRIAMFEQDAFVVRDLTGAEVSRVVAHDATPEHEELARDGVTMFNVAPRGHVVRHLITNFGARPWR